MRDAASTGSVAEADGKGSSEGQVSSELTSHFSVDEQGNKEESLQAESEGGRQLSEHDLTQISTMRQTFLAHGVDEERAEHYVNQCREQLRRGLVITRLDGDGRPYQLPGYERHLNWVIVDGRAGDHGVGCEEGGRRT
eukprot:2603031-Rhodomonas_salina.1